MSTIEPSARSWILSMMISFPHPIFPKVLVTLWAV
jgi:hypothetical protein